MNIQGIKKKITNEENKNVKVLSFKTTYLKIFQVLFPWLNITFNTYSSKELMYNRLTKWFCLLPHLACISDNATSLTSYVMYWNLFMLHLLCFLYSFHDSSCHIA